MVFYVRWEATPSGPLISELTTPSGNYYEYWVMTDCAGMHNMEWQYTNGDGFGSYEPISRDLASSNSESDMNHFTIE